MKKILIVNDGFPPNNWGGANSVAYLHAKGMRQRGWDARVFTTTQDSKVAVGWGEYEGIPVYTCYSNYHDRWWAYKSLNNKRVVEVFERELRALAPEVVHIHNIHHYVSYRAILIAKQQGTKVFLTAHDVMSFAYRKLRPGPYHVPWWVNFKDARLRFNPFRNFIIRRYLKQADQIFAVSEALKEALKENSISGNVSVVHNGIDTELFKPCPLPMEPTILFVGRFTPDKGRDVTLHAFKKVLESVPKAKLVVIGFPEGQYEPVMEKLIDDLDLRGRIILKPPVPYPQMPKEYCAASVVIVPSIIFDSFPTANLEAMAAGRPVVATCFGGSSEAVEDGVTGYIINPLDTKLLATAIISLLQNTELAENLGRKGREKVTEEFSLKKQIFGYEQFYFRSSAT